MKFVPNEKNSFSVFAFSFAFDCCFASFILLSTVRSAQIYDSNAVREFFNNNKNSDLKTGDHVIQCIVYRSLICSQLQLFLVHVLSGLSCHFMLASTNILTCLALVNDIHFNRIITSWYSRLLCSVAIFIIEPNLPVFPFDAIFGSDDEWRHWLMA